LNLLWQLSYISSGAVRRPRPANYNEDYRILRIYRNLRFSGSSAGMKSEGFCTKYWFFKDPKFVILIVSKDSWVVAQIKMRHTRGYIEGLLPGIFIIEYYLTKKMSRSRCPEGTGCVIIQIYCCMSFFNAHNMLILK